ncbi:MFS transporter [Inquilinus sp.]|jgi:predicted MFS family arabinose efflux permease|uniref:MFS transporter n=1 Tax=Inquilinus sp. TaxID=1932117 RepID=UPI003784BE1C
MFLSARRGYPLKGFAFEVALTAGPLTSMVGSINRKTLMAALIAVCCAGNLVTYLALSYAVVLVGRILVAAAIGVFWSTAVVTAVHLVSARHAVRATPVVFGGVSLATVLGIPAGTILGAQEGWRAVFAALAMLNLLVFAGIACSVPAVRISRASMRGAMSMIVQSGPLLAIFGTTALIVTGNFLAYTYVTPYLELVAQQAPGRISVMLLAYGIAGVVANFAVSPFAARWLRACLVVVTTLLAASLLAMNLAAASGAAMVGALAPSGALPMARFP